MNKKRIQFIFYSEVKIMYFELNVSQSILCIENTLIVNISSGLTYKFSILYLHVTILSV